MKHEHAHDARCAVCAAGGNVGSVIDNQLLPMMVEHGYAVLGVSGHNSSSFSYTVGLTMMGWPELILLGKTEWSYRMLQILVEYHRNMGRAPVEGDLTGVPMLDTMHPIRLHRCALDSKYPLTFAFDLFGYMTRALQVLIPDDDGKYPGDVGANKTWQVLLPSGL